MDPRIKNLKSTTFLGLRLTRQQIVNIRDIVRLLPKLSRHELARTVCEQMRWKTPGGQDRVAFARRVLEELERLGVLTLPALNRALGRGLQKPVEITARSAPQPAVEQPLAALAPLRLQVVTEPAQVALWNEFVARYHPLGYRRPFGVHLRYFVLDRAGRRLGCLLFNYASRKLPCRDEWIGWQRQQHRKQLDRVLCNSRFLLFPWVRVHCLASMALGLAARQLPQDWRRQHGTRPVLLETFVNVREHRGTCYKAAGWQCVGETQGGRPPRKVFVRPLRPDFRAVLLTGRGAARRRPASARRQRSAPAAPAAREEQFVALWRDIIADVAQVAAAYDREWIRRRRKINTLLVVLFVFRLVFAPDRQGYALTLGQLWEQCRRLGLPLPSERPVAASAMSNARAKVRHQAFRDIHRALLARAADDDPRWLWRGHRVFAVDGSKIHLPRPLLGHGYRLPSSHSHYPQGLLSCLYQLRTRLPWDIDLSSHGNERTAAATHLPRLRPGDVVVYDRGYYSYRLLRAHLRAGLQAVFRLKANANGPFRDFIRSRHAEALVTVQPTDTARRQAPQADLRPLRVRVLKYTAGPTQYALATTLQDGALYPLPALSNLYHARWGVEEGYKVVKRLLRVEPFHAQTERGVLQELWAACSLMAMARLFTNHAEAGFHSEAGKPPQRANFRNSLRSVGGALETLLLQYTATLHVTVQTLIDSISTCRQRERPHRSYPRLSRRPDDRWRPSKKDKPVAVQA